jgi:hypothetical protein
LDQSGIASTKEKKRWRRWRRGVEGGDEKGMRRRRMED